MGGGRGILLATPLFPPFLHACNNDGRGYNGGGKNARKEEEERKEPFSLFWEEVESGLEEEEEDRIMRLRQQKKHQQWGQILIQYTSSRCTVARDIFAKIRRACFPEKKSVL